MTRNTIDLPSTWTTRNARIAIQLAPQTVAEILGHAHTGDRRDDHALTAALYEAGAPFWCIGAEIWNDVNGWGVLGVGIITALDRASEECAANGRHLSSEIAKLHRAAECTLLADGVALSYEQTGPVHYMTHRQILDALLALGYIGGQR